MTSEENRSITIGLVQQKWNSDAVEHKANILRGVKEAVSRGAQIVFLQELTLHKYFGDAKNKEFFKLAEVINKGPTCELCSELSKSAGVFVAGSLFEKDEKTGKYYNTAVVFNPQGELQCITRKQHIPKGEGYDESFYFEPGDSDYPVHDLGFVKLALPTCYDQWFPELARIYALKGAELIVYPTAIGSEPTYKIDTQPQWQNMITAHAIANGVFVGAVNRIGDEGKVTFYGSSFVAAPTGEILHKASRDQEEVIVTKLDFGVQELWRLAFPLLWQRHPETYKRMLSPPDVKEPQPST